MMRREVPASALREGTVLLERTERGRVHTRATVIGTGRCATDPGNVHALVKGNRSGTNFQAEWCYFGAAPVEIEGR